VIFIPVNETLSIHIDRQHRIFIDRIDGGTVEVSLSEIRHLVNVLAVVAADQISQKARGEIDNERPD